MRDWLLIELQREKVSSLEDFVKANSNLEVKMRSMLSKHLNLNELQLQHWINNYKKGLSCEFMLGNCTVYFLL